MVKLKRLKIEKFRNVAPGTELHFRDSLNVLLGKNGTGKTTLLNLIVSLLSWNFEPLLGEPFLIEYELESSEGTLEIQLRNELRPFGAIPPGAGVSQAGLLEGVLLGSGGRYESSARIVAKAVAPEQAQVVEFEGARLKVLGGDGTLLLQWDSSAPIMRSLDLEQVRFFALLGLGKAKKMVVFNRILIFMRGVVGIRRFDESLGYLEHITRGGGVFDAYRAEAEYLVGSLDGGPEVALQEIGRRLEVDSEVDEVRVASEDSGAGFLARAVQLLGFQSARLKIQRIARETEPVEHISFGNIRFDFTRRDRSVTNHTLLSYGQKRLLSFYYYLACSPQCVVADELVNGMHHEWIEACLEDLGERQAFLTSQNPLLLDYLSFGSAEEVRSSFVLCRSEAHGEREQLRWENMAPEDAQGFFDAYQVGIQHVSEILRTRGLW